MGPERHRRRAEWALEALLARIGVVDWTVVEDGHADLGWGAEGASCSLPADAESWEFRHDHEPDADLDPLAMTFWWLARVEELLAPAGAFDDHGRFRWSASRLAGLDDPLAAPVDEYALKLASLLAEWRTGTEAGPAAAWRMVATHDIDLPWRWTRQGRRRALRAARDEVRRGQPRQAMRALVALAAMPVALVRRRDPWSNARSIVRLEAAHAARSTHYLLAARHAAEDGDAELHERGGRYLRDLLTEDGQGDLVGLHGSYTSSQVEGRIGEELRELQARAGRAVRDHRFHYLRHRPVDAWPALERAGVGSDASLGYAEQPGFRAGTAHPFRAWDHERDEPLALVVIPLALMDATFDARYLGVGTGWAGRKLAAQVLERVRELGGSASVLVHNDRLCNAASGGWTSLYVALLEQVRSGGGRACTAAEAAAAYRALLPAGRSPRRDPPETL